MATANETPQSPNTDRLQNQRLDELDKKTFGVAVLGVTIALASVLVSTLQWCAMREQLQDARSSAAGAQGDTDRALQIAESQAGSLKSQATSLDELANRTEALAEASRSAAEAAAASANSSKRIAKANEESVDTTLAVMRQDQRAWISLKTLRLRDPLSVGSVPTVVIEVTNTGRTPAIDARVYGSVFSRSAPLPPEPPPDCLRAGECKQSSAVLGPGAALFFPVDASAAIEKQSQIDAIETGTWRLYAVGGIVYSDIFGRLHRTEICMSADGAELRAGSFAACGEGNRTD